MHVSISWFHTRFYRYTCNICYNLMYILHIVSLLGRFTPFFVGMICWGFFYEQNPPWHRHFVYVGTAPWSKPMNIPTSSAPKSFVMASNGHFSHVGFVLQMFFFAIWKCWKVIFLSRHVDEETRICGIRHDPISRNQFEPDRRLKPPPRQHNSLHPTVRWL